MAGMGHFVDKKDGTRLTGQEMDSLGHLKFSKSKGKRKASKHERAPVRNTLEGSEPDTLGDTTTETNSIHAFQPQAHEEYYEDNSCRPQQAAEQVSSNVELLEDAGRLEDFEPRPGYVQRPPEQNIHLSPGHGEAFPEFAKQHCPGSTYPGTTSGGSSELGLGHSIPHSAISDFHMGPRSGQDLPQRGALPPLTPAPDLAHAQQPHLGHGHSPEPHATAPAFRYPAARHQKPHKHQLLAADTQLGNGKYVKRDVVADTQDRRRGPEVGSARNVRFEHRGPETRARQAPVAAAREARVQEPLSPKTHERTHWTLQSQHAEVVPQAEQIRGHPALVDEPQFMEGEPLNEVVAIDYDPEVLKEIDYAKLKTQPFDVDPRSSYQFPQQLEGNALAQKLEAIMSWDSEGAALEFFSSLQLSEWEEAGDWIIERFGQVMKRLVEARKEKRKAAAAFEDEIEGRYRAVGNRRKETDAALHEMKVNGGKILAGTPKKLRRK